MATIWYLWPVDNHPATNDYFVKIIGEQNAENECRDKLCADGVKRNLFRCPRGYANVRTAIAGIFRHDLKFEVFKAESLGVATEKPTRFDLWKASLRNSAKTAGLLRAVRRGA